MALATDLIDHFKLEADFLPDCVQHTILKSDTKLLKRRFRVVQRWKRRRVLGHGAFGIVWLESEQKGALRAVKEISKATAERLKLDYRRELCALVKLSKVCIGSVASDRPRGLLTLSKHNDLFVQLTGWYENNEHLFLSMEYFPLRDLATSLNTPLAEQHAKEVAKQLLEGLIIMHELGFTHRDMKPGVSQQDTLQF